MVLRCAAVLVVYSLACDGNVKSGFPLAASLRFAMTSGGPA